jgi:hypothetical protein
MPLSGPFVSRTAVEKRRGVAKRPCVSCSSSGGSSFQVDAARHERGEAHGGKPGVEPGNSVDVLIGSTYLVDEVSDQTRSNEPRGPG